METPRAIRGMSLRAKLVAIFIAIKVVPLVLLAVFAWSAARDLGQLVTLRAVSMSDVMRDTQMRTGQTAIDDAIDALDDRSREAIETLAWLVEIAGQRDTQKLIEAHATKFKKDLLSDEWEVTGKAGSREIKETIDGTWDIDPAVGAAFIAFDF